MALVTLKPGIRLRVHGGVGIEHNVMVTEEGDKTLATLPYELMRVQHRSEARRIRGLRPCAMTTKQVPGGLADLSAGIHCGATLRTTRQDREQLDFAAQNNKSQGDSFERRNFNRWAM